MKRLLLGLVVLGVSLLLVKERSRADSGVQVDLKSLQWNLLQPTVTKTDMGDGLPEVAILTMPDDQFQKISSDKNAAKKYLDSQKIFKRALIDVVFCDVTPSKDGGQWILIVPHTLHSTASIVAWQIPQHGTGN
jgi:hypothetical protein